MRPERLNPLFAPVTSLAGVGRKLAGALAKLLRTTDEPRIVDLLWHLPQGHIDRSYRPSIAEAEEGRIATVEIVVSQHRPPPPGNRRLPYRIVAHDDTGEIALVFFHGRADYLNQILPCGEIRVVSGRLERFSGALQMAHPDLIMTAEEADTMAPVEPVYALAAGITARPLRKAIGAAIDRCPELPEWQDHAWRTSQGWLDFRAALRAAHSPQHAQDLLPTAPARRRLAYDELLANQLVLGLVRARMRRKPGRTITGTGVLATRIREHLPYRLIPTQEHALAEIAADMAAPARMLRLLQGDVGAGKTVVALLAMAQAVESGLQAALMAPTEILARQHYAGLAPLCEAAGIRLALLTGREGRARQQLMDEIAAGRVDIVVGTHALFQEAVSFADLGLAVIDEQHRFGVHQRLSLQAKGRGVDVLVMSATPIPRTLTLTRYGDMEVSRLTEKPPGRQPIETRAVPLSKLDQVAGGLVRPLGEGARVYWVCPLVEDSDEVDATAAEQRFAALNQIYPGRVGLVHGRLKADAKDAVMAAFQAGDIDILVATTVIEVGVDVPEATVMVIEHAERFGLAQLHQLRGRVGRGAGASSCVLLYQPPLTETARARLAILRDTEDGFRIAEEDLRLRGAGELLGTRQSGTPEFRVTDLAVHGDLLAAARDDAELVLQHDPDLESERGAALRTMLYLFGRDDAVRLIGAG